MVCRSPVTNSSLTISGKRQDSSSLMPSPTTWPGTHKVCQCFVCWTDSLTVWINESTLPLLLLHPPAVCLEQHIHYVIVTVHVALCTEFVNVGREVCNRVFFCVSSGNRILAATERLQLWAPPLTDALIEEEDGQITDDKPHPVLNDWNCVWQCKYVVTLVHTVKALNMINVRKKSCFLEVMYIRSAAESLSKDSLEPNTAMFFYVYCRSNYVIFWQQCKQNCVLIFLYFTNSWSVVL